MKANLRAAISKIPEIIFFASVPASVFGMMAALGWPFELFSHFTVHIGLAALLSSIIFALRRERLFAALALVVVVAQTHVAAPILLANAPDAPSSPTQRILMVNVLYWNDNYSDVLSLVARENPDVVVVVEGTPEWKEELAALEEEYGYQYHQFAETIAGSGVSLYSRFSFAPLDIASSQAQDRPAFAAILHTSQGKVFLVGMHPRTPMLPSHYARRNQQLAEIASLVRDQELPTLLVGDLNITPFSPDFQAFLESGNLHNGRRGFGVVPSWPAPFRWIGIPIDHALHSQNIFVHDFRTGPYVGSDHYPIIVDFSVVEGAQ